MKCFVISAKSCGIVSLSKSDVDDYVNTEITKANRIPSSSYIWR
ncbi:MULTISPECIES: hypothetical protein [Lentihominibacter]|nr:hypothetical protein [Lentihominibacter hominis]